MFEKSVNWDDVEKLKQLVREGCTKESNDKLAIICNAALDVIDEWADGMGIVDDSDCLSVNLWDIGPMKWEDLPQVITGSFADQYFLVRVKNKEIFLDAAANSFRERLEGAMKERE